MIYTIYVFIIRNDYDLYKIINQRDVALHRGMGHCGYRRLEKFQTLLAAVVV
jgi:hypothetical protein